MDKSWKFHSAKIGSWIDWLQSLKHFFHQCVISYEPVRDKTNKMDQNMDFKFCVLVFFDIMDNAL